MLDLNALPARYIAAHGLDRIAEVLGKPKSVVAMWNRGEKWSLKAVARLVEFDPWPFAEIKPLYELPPKGTKLAILVPLIGPPEPKMVDSLMKLYQPSEMAYKRVAFNCLSVSRNALAAWALREGFEWLFWMDGDTVVPCGDAKWFKDAAELMNMPDTFAGLHAIHRMLWHKKTIMSCAYVSRRKPAVPQFGGQPEGNRMDMRRGPQDRVIERPWVGFGGILTHRSVFEDIIRTQGPEIKMAANSEIGKRFGYDYSFFHGLDRETPADDLPFCIRAGRAGHKCHVDLAVQAAHIGDRAYTYADIS